MYRAVIFDFFGVVAGDAYTDLLKSHGFERTGIFNKLSEDMDRDDISFEEFLKRLSAITDLSPQVINNEMTSFAIIDKEVVDLISKLKNNYPIGLLSNAPSILLRSIINNNKLGKLFDCVIISSEVKLIKPEPEIFKLILKEMNILPEEAVFIDNMNANIITAEKIGMKGILFENCDKLQSDLKHIGIKIA